MTMKTIVAVIHTKAFFLHLTISLLAHIAKKNLGPSKRKQSLTDIHGRNFTLANDHRAVLVKIDDDWVVSHKKSVPTVVDQTTPNADSGCQLFGGAFNWYLMTSVFVFRLIGIY